MHVRELIDGCDVAQAFVVRSAELDRTDGAGAALHLFLGDRTGAVAATVAGSVARAAEVCRPGTVVHVTGTFRATAGEPARLHVERVRAARPDEYEAATLLDGPPLPAQLMEADLRELIATVQNRHLRRLLDTVFDERAGAWSIYREAPAAKHYHQAYRHGLLEHCLTVAQAASAISAIFPGIDRDLVVTGALLHDIGKLEVYEAGEDGITMSDRGRLEGEIALGYYRIRRTLEQLEDFPEDLAQALTHIILSHHGSLAHGSPVVPCTREATLVHMMDNLGSRLGSFDRVQRDLPAGERWAAFDKGIGSGAYFPARSAAEPRRAA